MNIPTEKTERQKLAQNLLKNAGLFCDEVPELLENWILYTSPYNSNELYFLPMLEKLKENPDFVPNQKVEFFCEYFRGFAFNDRIFSSNLEGRILGIFTLPKMDFWNCRDK